MNRVTNNKRIAYVKRILSYSHNNKKIYGIILCKLFAIVLSVMTPFFYNIFIVNVLTDRKIEWFAVVAAGYIVVFALQCVNSVVNIKLYNIFLVNILKNIKKNLFAMCFMMKTKDYKKNNIGDLKNILENDIDSVDSIINTHFLDYYYQYVYALILLVIMLILSWQLTLVSVAMVPISFIFTKVMSKKAKKTSDDYRNKFGEYESFVWGELNNYKEVKSNNLEEKMVDIFRDYWYYLGKLFVRQQLLWFTNRTFISFKDFFIVKMNLYFVGGIMIINNMLDLPTLLVFMNYYASFFNAISIVMEDKIQFTSVETKMERILKVLDYEIPETADTLLKNLDIEFKNVSFRYQDESENVLKNVSLSIDEKQFVSFVGRSGCGKTTLINLIYRLYEADNGEITIGGQNVNNISPEAYGSKVSVVLQEPCFFNNTIRYNLLLANASATDKELYDALEKVKMFDFIKNQPKGLDTIVGENGIKLSGGQRQRLALARALLRNTDIIIFDEATSALDSKNEAQFMQVMDKFKKKKTIISVSHRLSTICRADKIYVIDDGEIVAEGTHEVLKENCAVYRKLFQKQFGEVTANAN